MWCCRWIFARILLLYMPVMPITRLHQKYIYPFQQNAYYLFMTKAKLSIFMKLVSSDNVSKYRILKHKIVQNDFKCYFN